ILLAVASAALTSHALEPKKTFMFQQDYSTPYAFVGQPNFTNAPLLDSPKADTHAEPGVSQIVEDILAEAGNYLGIRYRRGGKTPAGFDCSGFTGYIFKQFGYRLGASSSDQYARDGVAVPNDDIRPGDLVFFKGRSKGTVGHVGIAVDRDPATGVVTFIHSATSSGIRYDRTSAPYYKQRFLGARRVVTQ
ncbi:MAG: C40 family peptidase, partial [Muribaculaceae bacterium]|nr:C40 family peptidase [Muribaculaceae bacterium]